MPSSLLTGNTDDLGGKGSFGPPFLNVQPTFEALDFALLDPYFNTVMGDQPRAYWRLGETSGSTIAAEAMGLTDSAYGSSVKLGAQGGIAFPDTAAVFDGTANGNILIPDHASLNLTSNLSIEFYARTTYGGASSLHIYGGYDSTTPFAGIGVSFISGRVSFWRGTAWVSAATPTNDGTWHHYVITHDGINARFYIDGALVTTTAAAAAASYAGNRRIGARSDGTQGLVSTIDEVALYGYMLGPTQVLTHYNVGALSRATGDWQGAAAVSLGRPFFPIGPKLNVQTGIDALVGGVFFPQELSANVTTTVTFTSQVGKVILGSVTTTAGVQNQIGKPLSATTTTSATMVRRVGKNLSATATTIATLAVVKVILQALTAAATVTASMIRQVGKPLNGTATVTASLIKQVGKRLSATATATATMTGIKVILRTLTAAVTTTASIVRQIGLHLSATSSSSATVARQIGKRLTATATSTASLLAQKVILKALTATVVVTATMTRNILVTFTATATSTATVTKRIGKILTSTVTAGGILEAIWAGISAIVTRFFDRPSPDGGDDPGSPTMSSFEGLPHGGADSGSPDADSFDGPSPGRTRT